MLFGEFDEVRKMGHRAVRIQYLTDDSDWAAARQSRQINRSFSMAGALQDSAGPRTEWENVSGLDKVFRHRRWLRHDADCFGAIRSADARCNSPSGINADLKIRFECLPILANHSLDAKLLEALGRSRDAN